MRLLYVVTNPHLANGWERQYPSKMTGSVLKKPVETYNKVKYYREAVCPGLFAASPIVFILSNLKILSYYTVYKFLNMDPRLQLT
jgi:hypothetical protein